jgi:hypothetical protein
MWQFVGIGMAASLLSGLALIPGALTAGSGSSAVRGIGATISLFLLLALIIAAVAALLRFRSRENGDQPVRSRPDS